MNRNCSVQHTLYEKHVHSMQILQTISGWLTIKEPVFFRNNLNHVINGAFGFLNDLKTNKIIVIF